MRRVVIGHGSTLEFFVVFVSVFGDNALQYSFNSIANQSDEVEFSIKSN